MYGNTVTLYTPCTAHITGRDSTKMLLFTASGSSLKKYPKIWNLFTLDNTCKYKCQILYSKVLHINSISVKDTTNSSTPLLPDLMFHCIAKVHITGGVNTVHTRGHL